MIRVHFKTGLRELGARAIAQRWPGFLRLWEKWDRRDDAYLDQATVWLVGL